MPERKCVGCGELKDNLIKITRRNPDNIIIVNPDNKTFGRSAYLCYNISCIEAAFKKNKISKVLKAAVPEDIKGQLLGLRNNQSK